MHLQWPLLRILFLAYFATIFYTQMCIHVTIQMAFLLISIGTSITYVRLKEMLAKFESKKLYSLVSLFPQYALAYGELDMMHDWISYRNRDISLFCQCVTSCGFLELCFVRRICHSTCRHKVFHLKDWNGLRSCCLLETFLTYLYGCVCDIWEHFPVRKWGHIHRKSTVFHLKTNLCWKKCFCCLTFIKPVCVRRWLLKRNSVAKDFPVK